MDEFVVKIENALADNPPHLTTEGGIFKKGYNPNIDELRQLSGESKNYLLHIETEEKQE